MKTNKLYICREIAGEALLVPVGEETKKFNGMISLTGISSFIWSQIDSSKDIDELVARVLEEYEIDEDTARKDIMEFLKECQDRSLVSEVPDL